jgi:hypothetical protein
VSTLLLSSIEDNFQPAAIIKTTNTWALYVRFLEQTCLEMSWDSCSFVTASSVTPDFTELRDEVGSQVHLLPPMATREAPRRVVGARVHAKAIHVSNLAECARRYGALKSTKMVAGTVGGCRS